MANRDRVSGQSSYARERGHAAAARPRWLAALVLLAAIATQPPAFAAHAVDIAAAVGFSETFQPGHWTPLTVTVTNRGAPLSGEVEVQVTGDDASRSRQLVTYHRRSLELHGNARKSVQFTVLPQGLFHPLVIRVRADGREIARSEVDLHDRFAAQRLLLVLSRNADLDYLNDSAVDGLRVLYPHPELLPGHWRGYDAVAAIVLHGVSLERLSAGQFEALHKWIAQGGTLAVSGGPERRPLEITIVSVDDVVPWRYPPRLELQYGEWLREDALRGDPLGPGPSPDLAVLVTQIRGRSVPLEGPPADVVLDPVPEDDLRRAMVESLPSLLEALHGDERNVILTLARMWVTVESGEIVPKDVAADRLLPRVERSGSRQVLQLARDAYRGDTWDDWTGREDEIGEFVDEATKTVRRSSGEG